jgi:hypothetical protein
MALMGRRPYDGVKEGRIGAGGDYSSSMQTGASIDDGGRHRPMVAMGPHSQLRLLILSIQQSTNILGNRLEVSIVKTRKSYH